MMLFMVPYHFSFEATHTHTHARTDTHTHIYIHAHTPSPSLLVLQIRAYHNTFQGFTYLFKSMLHFVVRYRLFIAIFGADGGCVSINQHTWQPFY